MPNQNCLEGMACPECGSEGPLQISATVLVEVHDDGVEGLPRGGGEGYQWASDSYCRCPQCEHEGTVGDFDNG